MDGTRWMYDRERYFQVGNACQTNFIASNTVMIREDEPNNTRYERLPEKDLEPDKARI